MKLPREVMGSAASTQTITRSPMGLGWKYQPSRVMPVRFSDASNSARRAPSTSFTNDLSWPDFPDSTGIAIEGLAMIRSFDIKVRHEPSGLGAAPDAQEM